MAFCILVRKYTLASGHGIAMIHPSYEEHRLSSLTKAWRSGWTVN